MTGNAGERTAYDLVAYPSGVFPLTHPDHLAAVARLHGLTPPPVETARVLDIGGGDGMNVLSMAETLPRARFVSFDLAREPVARGQAIAAATGLGTVRVEVGDILDCNEVEGPFDYVVAHGVYAWVPQPVREALLALVARVLAPNGVAFVSYNALPGGYYRRILRDMTLHEICGVTGTRERAGAAQRFLHAFSQPRENDLPTLAPLRTLAGRMATKDPELLFHDELADCYTPHAFADVVAAAAGHGLRFLNDAEPDQLGGGLPDEVLDEAGIARAVQSADYAQMRFFHKTLFVHDRQAPQRSLALEQVRDLYISAQVERTGPTSFKSASATVTLTDEQLIAAIATAAEAWPGRVRVSDVTHDELRLAAVYRLFRGEVIGLHAAPFHAAATPGSRPRASRLARTLVTMGEERIFTLDQRAIQLDDAAARALLLLLDGSREREAIETDWAAAGHSGVPTVEQALARLASLALLVT